MADWILLGLLFAGLLAWALASVTPSRPAVLQVAAVTAFALGLLLVILGAAGVLRT